MKKRSCCILAIVLLLSLFGGCTGNVGSAPSADPTVLTAYVPCLPEEEGDTQADSAYKQTSNQQFEKMLAQKVELFNSIADAGTLEVECEAKLYPAGSQGNKQMKLDLMTGQGPDLFLFYNGISTPYELQENLLDLTPMLEKSERVSIADLQQEVFSVGRVGEKQIAAPLDFSLPSLVTSREALEAFGLSGGTTAQYGALSGLFEQADARENALLLKGQRGYTYTQVDAWEMAFWGQFTASGLDRREKKAEFSPASLSAAEDFEKIMNQPQIAMPEDSEMQILGEYRYPEEIYQKTSVLFTYTENAAAVGYSTLALLGGTPTDTGYIGEPTVTLQQDAVYQMLRMPGEEGNFAVPHQMLAISKNAGKEEQQAAFRLIEFLLSEQGQFSQEASQSGMDSALSGVPVNRAAREAYFEQAMQYWQAEGMPEKTQELFRAYFEEYNHITGSALYDHVLIEEVFLPAIRDSGLSEEQKLEQMNNRAGLYLKEQG